MSNGNWIKLNRKILKWEWYSDNSTRSVFLHALLKANYEPSRYKGHELAIGDVVFGRKKWAEELGLSERQVRTAITHLKETGEISTIKVTNKFTILHVENWEFYQSKEDEATNNMTNERPTTDQQPTNNRPRTKKEKKEKNEKKDKNYIYSRATHDIIQHLNERTGSQYKPTTKKTKELIQARMNEGFTVEDFKTVIDKKCVEWMNTEWQEYLRPVTLFGTKFESYLNAPVPKQTTGNKFLDALARGEFRE
jgi:uncharacterized phage protein (TIGR02220 family)